MRSILTTIRALRASAEAGYVEIVSVSLVESQVIADTLAEMSIAPIDQTGKV